MVTFTSHLNMIGDDKKIKSKNIFEFYAFGVYVTNSRPDVDMGTTQNEQLF